MSKIHETPRSGRWTALLLAGAAVCTLACITINVYFPEAAVRDLSQKIEDAVAEEAAKAAAEEAGSQDADATGDGGALSAAPAPASWPERLRAGVLPIVLELTASEARAQGRVAEPEISNPAIRRIIESRGQRLPELQPYKNSGVLGESNQALLEIRDLGSLALQDRAQVQKLVKAENADRERMFKEIAAATGTDLSQLPKVRETYAATLRANASKGEVIQMPDGTWKKK